MPPNTISEILDEVSWSYVGSGKRGPFIRDDEPDPDDIEELEDEDWEEDDDDLDDDDPFEG